MTEVLFHARLRFRIEAFATGLQGICPIFVPFKESVMKIGLIDRAMFAVMSSTCVEELRKEHPEGTFNSK